MDIQHGAIVKTFHGENIMLGGRTGFRAPFFIIHFSD
jgi:hypothetical protein